MADAKEGEEQDVTEPDETFVQPDSPLSVREMFEGKPPEPNTEPDKQPTAPEPEAEDTEPEPEVEPEPEPEAEPEPLPDATPEWDAVRQEKDQEIANLRKENETLQVAALDTDKPDKPTDDPLADIEPLVEFADEDDRNQAMNKIIAKVNAGQQQTQQRDNKAAYDTILKAACGKFGEEHRNAIVKEMKDLWAARGYGPGNYPEADQTEDAVFRIGYAVKEKAAGKPKPKPKPRPRPNTVSDTGAGGAEVMFDGEQTEGTIDEVDAIDAANAAKGVYPWSTGG